MENYQSYCDRAKLITSVHATPRKRPVEFDTPPAEEPSNVEASSSSSTTSRTTPPTVALATPTSPPLVPIVTHKSASPAPPFKHAPSDKDGVLSLNKERHVSPSPLGTADANVDAKTSPTTGAGVVMGMGMTATPALAGSKSTKRAATGGAPTVAEKRKKALKRL